MPHVDTAHAFGGSASTSATTALALHREVQECRPWRRVRFVGMARPESHPLLRRLVMKGPR